MNTASPFATHPNNTGPTEPKRALEPRRSQIKVEFFWEEFEEFDYSLKVIASMHSCGDIDDLSIQTWCPVTKRMAEISGELTTEQENQIIAEVHRRA